MALVKLETYYNFPNLSDENNVFRYSPGFIGGDSTQQRQWIEVQISEGSYDLIDIAETIKIAMKRNGLKRQWIEVQISEGSYDLIDIAETIKIAMKRNGHNDDAVKMSANTNTLKSVLEIQGDFQVDFRREIQFQAFLDFEIGFTKKVFTSRKMLSTSYQ